MQFSGWTSRIWVLAIALGLAVASCAMQKGATLIKGRTLPHKQQAATSTSKEPGNSQAKIQVAYTKLPLHFEPNQGQTDEQVHFFSRGRGYTLFLTSTEAVLALRKPHKNSLAPVSGSPTPTENSLAPVLGERVRVREPDSEPPEQTVLRMKLVGANPNPRIEALEELPGKVNYLIGNDPQKWHTNIPTYAKVKYQDAYPGVDLIYYGNQRQLEYDFVVAPGTNPKAIRIAFDGLVGAGPRACPQEGDHRGSPLRIDDNGDLILHTAGGEIHLHKPHIYQEINGVQQPISGGYVLLSPQSSSLITFQVAAYDTSKLLVIDPVLSYSTYLGGSNDDVGLGIAVDSSGNAYVTGDTHSTNFPTASPLQATFGGSEDVFVTKLNPTGSALVYSTYLGGSGDDSGEGIAVDASGNAYVTGYTFSTNFPTVSPFQATHGGGTSDAFVTKINAAGSALVYSTYLGGSGGDRGSGIAVDASGNAYVTGETSSTNFPTASPFQPANGGGLDAFVVKLNATGSTLVYSTYLGGSGPGGGGRGNDDGSGIAVDASGNAYVTGYTRSTNFPTQNPLQATNRGGFDGFDAFVTKLDATGTALIYSTYLGGSGDDGGEGIAVDASGNAYVMGWTFSTNFPTASPLQATNAGSNDVFVTKLNAAGSALLYSTYLGGSSDDTGFGIAVDASGNAYVTGQTRSTNFPTASPLQTAFAGVIYDAFVAKIVDVTFTLTVTKSGTGSGTVTSSPAGINCGSDCTESYTNGTTVTLTAAADSGSTFEGWSGDCSGTGSCVLSMTTNRSVTATFDKSPVLSVTPTSLDFGSVTVGSTKDHTFTVTNSGGGTLTGNVTTSSPYSIVSGSSFSLTAGASQVVTVRFSPASTGTFLGNASVSSNGGSASVSLSGTGVSCTYSISPTSATFGSSGGTGSVSVSTTRGCSWTAVSNVSWITITSGSSGSGNGTVGYSVAANTNTSSRTGTLTIAGQTFTVTQSAPPVLSVSPTSLDFGNVTVNSTKDLTFTVTNSGDGTLTGNVTTSPPFSIVSGSSFSLGAGASQTVTVRFSPTTTGTFLGTANVSSNGGNTAVTLSGTGTPAPSLSVSTTSLDFGNVTVNSTKDLTFTVTNSGGGTLTGSVTASSPFSVISGSSFSLGAGASQTVTVRFSPTSAGAFTGTATVSSNGGSATVSLSGTGVEEKVPLLLVTPTSLSFGSVTVGSSSDQSFTVTNSGGGILTGTATTNLPFSIVSGGSFSLAAGATQTVTVRFSPTSTGAFADIVSVSSNGGNTSVTLSGTGTEVSSPVLSVFPTSLGFGEVALGSSKDLLFTVTNTGSGTLTGTVTASSPFSITSGGSFSLGTGASQTITVRFSPTVESFVSSTSAVNSNGGNAVVTLTGTGTTIQTPLLSVTPPSLDFGGVLVGSSLDLLFFVQNSGGGTLVGTVSTSAPGFSIVSGSSFTLTAGATQTVTVRFSPTEGGTFSGTVTVSSNGGGATVTVTGVGTEVPQPNLTITPSILNFGSVRVGKSKDLSFTVQNTGEGTLAGTATATDPFSVVTNSSFTLEAGELMLVTVRFSPPTTGPFTGTVEFTSNGGNFTATVTGRGRGKLLPFGLREAVRVAIDIQPDSKSNAIDCQSSGEIAVGILNVLELPSPLEVSTLELEGATPPQSWVTTDVDGDGAADDVAVYFKTQGVSDEACQEGAHSFFLTGELADGTPIEGSDEVNIVRWR